MTWMLWWLLGSITGFLFGWTADYLAALLRNEKARDSATLLMGLAICSLALCLATAIGMWVFGS